MKIALIGYGKMGKAIEEIAIENGHEIVLKIHSANKDEAFTAQNIRNADVAIEFTNPSSAFDNISFCLNQGVSVVSGTTGWLQHLPEAKDLCLKKNTSFLYASNFSIGVNVFFALNKKLAGLMKHLDQYEVKIEEIHHIHKKDAPSGTAITLAEAIIESGKKKNWVNKESTNADELYIESKRTDEVPGTHLVNYTSANDSIEIIHTAFSRKGFAAGAVAAAQYISGKKGVFTMLDVLGIE